MAINAADPIPVRLVVCPAGIIRSVPIQKHTTVHFLARDKRGRVQIDQHSRDEGWAFVDDLYEEELEDRKITKQRRRELEQGRKDLRTYCVKHGAGRNVAFQLNPGGGKPAAGVRTFPGWALPTGVTERRETHAARATSFDVPIRPGQEQDQA